MCTLKVTFSYVRSESGADVTSAVHQGRPEDGDSDDDRGSGEYYSGEEFHDDDIMLTKDRWAVAALRWTRGPDTPVTILLKNIF